MSEKYVVFDLWYTLIYFPKGWETFNHLKREFDLDPNFWREKIKPIFLCKHQTEIISFLRDFMQVTGIKLDENEHAMLMNQILVEDFKECRLYEDSIETLINLRKKRYKLGVISNQASFYEPCYCKFGLDKIIDMTVFSNRVGVRKPNEEIYKYFLNRVGITPQEVIMVGDDYNHDYLIPKKIGMKSLWLRRNSSGERNEIITTLKEISDYL